MTERKTETLAKGGNAPLESVTAVIVTTAAFAKLFLPFYLLNSTAIFAVTSVIGIALLTSNWPSIRRMGRQVSDAALLLITFYGLVTINFLVFSRPVIPMTHLIGILIFHGLFFAFGFASARALKTVLLLLLSAGGIYLIIIANYT